MVSKFFGFRRRLVVLTLTSSLVALFDASAAYAQDALPTGGTVASGSAGILTAPNVVTVNQSTPQAIINWSSFSVAQGNAVIFNQPNANSATLNRVTGGATSTIAGQITSNGAVYLINPNGIAITATGNVQTGGGFIASTLDLGDDDFNAGKLNFKGRGASGRVSNAGSINAASNAYVALLGGSVSNSGTINVPLGRVGLGSGESITLDLNGDGFMQVAVPTSAVTASGEALIDMAGSITASGGRVELRAATVRDAIRNVINMSGNINADSATRNGGSIILFGGASSAEWGGTVSATGTLSARATGATGDGGFVETSGATVDFGGLLVDASAAYGKTGTWLIDPINLTVDAAAAATISTNLATANVTLQTTATTASGPGVQTVGPGDITINSAINWASANTLTLDSVAGINLNAAITTPLGGLRLDPGTNTTLVSAIAAINVGTFTLVRGAFTQNTAALPSFSATNFNISPGSSTFIRATGGNGTLATPYLISDIYGLQGIASSSLLTSSFALAGNIDASGTANWNGGLGFVPIGTDGISGTFNSGNGFSGNFNGNGFSISGLTINRPAFSNVGFFGTSSGAISNVNLVGGSFTGGRTGLNLSITASIVAFMAAGSLTDVTSSASVTGANGADAVLVPGTPASNSFTGGLVGFQQSGSITRSSATGAVTGGNGGNGTGSTNGLGGASYTGGLVGFFSMGSITQSFATGNVVGGSGGSATSSANGGSSRVGGLVGQIDAGSITSSYSLSNVTGGRGGASSSGASGASFTGGLVGLQNTASIAQSYFNGNVIGGNAGNATFGTNAESLTGGLVGAAFSSSSITDSNSTGTVRGGSGGANSVGGNSATGGLIGAASGNTISNSRSTANVAGGNAGMSSFGSQFGSSNTGGFVGLGLNATISRSYATGTVAGGVATGTLVQFTNAGGFAGALTGGTTTQAYATGAVTGGVAGVGSFNGASAIAGGFVGNNAGAITQSYATGRVTGGTSGQLSVGSTTIGSVTGGFVGYNFAAGNIAQAYATGAVTQGSTGAIFTGGFGGFQETGSNISNSYYDSFSTLQSAGVGTNNGTATSLLSVTSDPAQSAAANYAYNTASYANFTAGAGLGTANPTGWVFFNGQTRPFLAFEVPASGSTIVNSHQLQLIGLGTSLAGTYTLGANIDLSETGANLGTAATSAGLWRSAGFVPLGTDGAGNFWNGTAFGSGTPLGFSGSLNGGGFTVRGLTVNRPAVTYAGLFGFVTGSISNLNLTGVNVTGRISVGGLAGYLFNGANVNGVNTSGIVAGAFGSVTGSVGNVGGLAGVLQGASITNSSSAGSVDGAAFVGGLVGFQFGTGTVSTISNSSSSATVTGHATTQANNNNYIGGLVGYQRNGTINTNVSATGTVSGAFNVGGLVGVSDGNASPFTTSNVSQLTDVFATGNVSGTSGVGGLAGTLFPNASLLRGYATGNVIGSTNFTGGLIGIFNGASINQAYATGAVVGVTNVGGLVGIQASPVGGSSSISNAYATGVVAGTTNVGGLVGRAQGATNSISNSYAAGLVNNNIAGATIGGLLGSQASTAPSVTSSYWDATVNSLLSSAGGTGLTTLQLQDFTTFSTIYAGWDFTTIWEVPNQAGQNGTAIAHYPRLRFHLTP